jgi:hypothetical protein
MNALRTPAAPSGISAYMGYLPYIVAALVVYYLVNMMLANPTLDVKVTGTTQTAAPPEGAKTFAITDDPRIRIKSGGEYTFTFWMYVNSWGDRGGKPQNVLTIVDEKMPDSALLAVMLYPTEPMMAIRLHDGVSQNYTNNASRKGLLQGSGGNLAGGMGTKPQCDLQDIDLQRWINITVTTNGRVVDVYYDGKLARSCILKSIIMAGPKGKQSVVIGEYGGFQGSFGLMNYYGVSLTPDRIYSIYLAGPGGPPSFLGYLESKLGINISYSGKKTSDSAAASSTA